MPHDVDCDVLIAGLGPVGAALGVLLSDAGLSVVAIDRDTAVYPMPRAAHFDFEIMRIFQQMGIADAVLAHAQTAPAYEFRNAAGDVLMHFDLEGRGSPAGWPASFMFHQPGLEHALRARLAEASTVDIRLGHALQGLGQNGDSVASSIGGPDGEYALTSRYLVGCDGARSVVRESCSIGLDDYGFDEPWLVIDVKAGPAARLPKINLQLCDPARPTTSVLMGPGRHRWEFMLRPGETPEQVLDDAFIRALLVPWDIGTDFTLERKAVYRFHGLVAKTWRDRRVLLAGDAAHQTPPFAGQGMCSGIRDAANLAWKLAAVVRDGASDALLDTYQREREPHTRALIERAIFMGRVVCMSDPTAAAARDADFLARRRSGAEERLPAAPDLEEGFLLAGAPGAGAYFPQPWAGTTRLDDVLGAGAWLIADGPVPQAPDLRAVSLADLALAPFRDALAGWLSARKAAAVLVRPDRYVFGCGSPDALIAAYRARLSPPAT